MKIKGSVQLYSFCGKFFPQKKKKKKNSFTSIASIWKTLWVAFILANKISGMDSPFSPPFSTNFSLPLGSFPEISVWEKGKLGADLSAAYSLVIVERLHSYSEKEGKHRKRFEMNENQCREWRKGGEYLKYMSGKRKSSIKQRKLRRSYRSRERKIEREGKERKGGETGNLENLNRVFNSHS